MSHFTVAVRLPAATPETKLEAALASMLAPYQENNMGDCPREFLEFNDEEDEYRKDYETGSTTVVVLEDGSRVMPWDERFRVPGQFGIGSGTHKVPDHLKKIEVPHRERFATFEEFVADWHGRKGRDPEKGRFGYWENPNAKWDWWTVGGRWSDMIPLRPGHMVAKTDAARLSAIDWDRVDCQTTCEMEEFWVGFEKLRAGAKDDDPFDGPRSTALSRGLIDCKPAAELKGDERIVYRWSHKNRDGSEGLQMADVFSEISRDEFMANYRAQFCSLRAWATLDETGWRERGEMGWFGMSNATPESTREHAEKAVEWMRGGNQEDWLIVVDCHI